MCLANGPPMIDYKKLTHYELLLVVFVHAISVLSPYKDHLFTTCPMSEMCIEYNLQSQRVDFGRGIFLIPGLSKWDSTKYFFQIKMYLVHSGRELVQQHINTSQYLKAQRKKVLTTVLFRNYGHGYHYMSQPLSDGDINIQKQGRDWTTRTMTFDCYWKSL